MENNIYKIAFVEDMIFDLCVNKTMLLSPEKFITDEDRDWFDLRLWETMGLIREKIAFLLSEEDAMCADVMCLSLERKYRFHHTILAVRIETAIIDTICEKWLREYLATENDMGKNAFDELKSFALRQDKNYKRNSYV